MLFALQKALDKLAENLNSRILITLRFSASFASRRFNAAASVRPGSRGVSGTSRKYLSKTREFATRSTFANPRTNGAGRCWCWWPGSGSGEKLGTKKRKSRGSSFSQGNLFTSSCLFLWLYFLKTHRLTLLPYVVLSVCL